MTERLTLKYCFTAVFAAVAGFAAGYMFQLYTSPIVFFTTKADAFLSDSILLLTAIVWGVVFLVPFLIVRLTRGCFVVPTPREYCRSLWAGLIGFTVFGFPVSMAFAVYHQTYFGLPKIHGVEGLAIVYPMFPVIAICAMLLESRRRRPNAIDVA